MNTALYQYIKDRNLDIVFNALAGIAVFILFFLAFMENNWHRANENVNLAIVIFFLTSMIMRFMLKRKYPWILMIIADIGLVWFSKITNMFLLMRFAETREMVICFVILLVLVIFWMIVIVSVRERFRRTLPL